MIAVALATAALCVTQPTPTLAELIDAHEKGVARLRTVDAEFDEVYPNGTLMVRGRWSFDGARERHRYEYPQRGDNSRGKFWDILIANNEVQVLRDWNPRSPPELSPFQSKGVSAHIEPLTKNLSIVRARYGLLLNFRLSADDAMYTLRELALAAPAGTSPKVMGEAKCGEHRVWHLRFPHPGVSTSTVGGLHRGSFVDVFLDPQAQFLARKVAYVTKPDERRASPTVECTRVLEVTAFQDCEDGTYFPTEVTGYLDAEGYSRHHTPSLIVTKLSVNEELSEDAFAFSFPEHATVAQFPAGPDGRVPVHVIGKDNVRVATIRTRQELDAALRQAAIDASSRPGIGSWKWYIGGLALLATSIGVVGYVRRNRRHVA